MVVVSSHKLWGFNLKNLHKLFFLELYFATYFFIAYSLTLIAGSNFTIVQKCYL